MFVPSVKKANLQEISLTQIVELNRSTERELAPSIHFEYRLDIPLIMMNQQGD